MNKTARLFLWFGLALVGLIAWRFLSPYSVPWVAEQLGDDAMKLWNYPYFHLGSLAITPGFLLKVFVFLALLTVFSRVARSVLRRQLQAHTAFDEGQRFAAERGTGYVIFFLGLVVGLQSVGLNLNSLAVLGGSIGIGIGFGLQNIANNFISGLILLTERPIKVGDRVEIEGVDGKVLQVGARATWVRTNANRIIIVPNADLVTNRVTNWTANDRTVRFAIPLGVSYGSDPEQVRDVLLGVAKANHDILDDPPADVIFVGFGDSSLNFELRIWTITKLQTPKVITSELYFEIFRAFREHKIEIPFPQRDLHLRSVASPIPIAGAEQEPLPA